MRREGALSHNLTRGDVDIMESMYDASVAFADDEIGRLIDQLPEDVLVIVVGDHGEEFLDHGHLFHGHTVYEELIHVPLIVRGPQFDPTVTAEIVSHVDVTPTILEVLGVPVPEGLSGKSFHRALTGKSMQRREPVFSVREYEGQRVLAARQDNWKLIYVDPGNRGLFELNSDPEEQHNVVHEHADLVERLEASINQHLERVREAGEDDSLELHEERMKALRSLGYVN
jgi:arylsulfatase A-like enzyme